MPKRACCHAACCGNYVNSGAVDIDGDSCVLLDLDVIHFDVDADGVYHSICSTLALAAASV